MSIDTLPTQCYNIFSYLGEKMNINELLKQLPNEIILACLYDNDKSVWFKRYTTQKGIFDSFFAGKFAGKLHRLLNPDLEKELEKEINEFVNQEPSSFVDYIFSVADTAKLVDDMQELKLDQDRLVSDLTHACFDDLKRYNNNEPIIKISYHAGEPSTSIVASKGTVIFTTEKGRMIYLYTPEDKEFIDQVLAPFRNVEDEK